MTRRLVTFDLGNRPVDVVVEPLTSLQIALREQLGYTGVKDGCRQGGCGSCTVLVDGEPLVACLLPVEDVAGKRVDTVETQTPVEGLSDIQQAFLDHNALQCGYCTPGFVVLTSALLDRNPAPGEAEIIEAISGNFCRCTGYRPIIDAILSVAATRNEGRT